MSEQTPLEEKGNRPVLAECPSFEILGQTYMMRRLNLADHCRFATIFRAAWKGGKVDLAAIAQRGDAKEMIEAAVSMLLAAFAEGGSETLDFLATIIGVEKRTLLNPEVFPFSSLPLILRKLVEHPDLRDFFAGGLGALVGGTPIPMPNLNLLLTSSLKDMAGQTA